MNYYFEYPLILLLLFGVPAFWLWYVKFYVPRRLLILLSYDPRQFGAVSRDWSLIRLLPAILISTAWALMVIALARPKEAEGLFDRTSEGIDIFLLFDTSASMETKDMAPDRITVARMTAADFVRKSQNDRIGIIVFAQDAFAFVPLTFDRDFLLTQINELNTDILPKEGTALGPAIAAGVNRFRESKNNALVGAQVMILITDGVHNTGFIDPLNAAMAASGYGYRIYPISIGKDKYLHTQDDKTQSVKTELDEETLRKIASITGGRFFRAGDQSTLREALYTISKLEKSIQRQPRYKQIHDRYNVFLIPAVVLLLAGFGLKFAGYYNTLEG